MVADRERARLRATPDPESRSGGSLYDRILEILETRLVVMQNATPVDRRALEVARCALLAGEAGTGMIYQIAVADPTWLCDHAADIVRAKPGEVADCRAARR